jgi:putative tryptophan/tyrosine transport system substrate-binding protein
VSAKLKRRAFITLLGGAAAAWPLAARAQQPAMPVIGFLNSQSPEAFAGPLRGFRQGLKDGGYVENESLAIEYRWADAQIERLPALAADLVRRQVAVIVTTGGASTAVAAKAATTTIPIVFTTGDDPVRLGLVASFARPDANLTGISFLVTLLSAKRFEFLRALAPGAVRVAALVNPAEVANTEITLRDLEVAARTLGLHIQVFKADTGDDINDAFENIARERPDALFVAATPFFVARRVQLTQLAAFHRVPAAYPLRDFAEAGGLVSYGASIADAYRQVGAYTARILKGAKPSDLPVVQSSKLELIINRQTAKMLGLTVPPALLATADEVLE